MLNPSPIFTKREHLPPLCLCIFQNKFVFVRCRMLLLGHYWNHQFFSFISSVVSIFCNCSLQVLNSGCLSFLLFFFVSLLVFFFFFLIFYFIYIRNKICLNMNKKYIRRVRDSPKNTETDQIVYDWTLPLYWDLYISVIPRENIQIKHLITPKGSTHLLPKETQPLLLSLLF